jgi:urease accessory protein
MRADLDIGLHRRANGAVHASGSLAVPPFWCRWDGETLWIVGSAASPVGDDHISLTIEVGRGVTARVRNVAATVVYAGRGDGTTLRTALTVGEGATLIWQPEPLIITNRALHQSVTTIDVKEGGSLLADEIIVFGRTDEDPGRLRTMLELRLDDETTALTSFDTGLPGWDGPGGTDGAKVLATRVLVEPQSGPASTEPSADTTSVALRPEGGGAIATALAPTPSAAREALARRLDLGGGRTAACA